MLDGFFSQDFLKSLPSDRLEASANLYQEFDRFQTHIYLNIQHHEDIIAEQIRHHENLVEILAIFKAFAQSRGFSMKFPDVGPDKVKNVDVISQFLHENGKRWVDDFNLRTSGSLLSEKTEQYGAIFGSVEVYQFTDEQIGRIQKLINELRDLISASNLISADHKRRLLKRLEAMQAELHKNTSDIERFWGFWVEAGLTARKFGEDLKPITDRVTELAKIVVSAVMLKEGVKALPEITKLLGSEDESTGE